MIKKTGASAPVFLRYHFNMNYQAKLSAPFAVLGVRCDDVALFGIDFLPQDESPQHATCAFAQQVCEQLERYLENPDAQFSIPYRLTGRPVPLSSTLSQERPLLNPLPQLGEEANEKNNCLFLRERGQTNRCANFTILATPHRLKVWQAIALIPRGETRSYGELAIELHSGAQAIGQACGANPLPIVIPCHRVTGRAGLGGFMKSTMDSTLDIKRWLLAHEGAL
ncbi:MAG: MGMT family protein [Gallionella sp.]|nr:MGMT family protein [Gallionella sp.]